MEDQSGLLSFIVVFFILCLSIIMIIYWYDIDHEENEARTRQSYDRVEWSNFDTKSDKDKETLV